jgi:sulfite dehydrogenase
MSHGYRITPPGATPNPDLPSVQEMGVKSWVNMPNADRSVKAGTVYVTGVAMGGTTGVRRVEVSSDGGKTWLDAAFVGPDLGRFAWRQFAVPLRMAPGNYVVTSRATDAAGNVQPEQRLENAQGYSNNSWADHAVKVSVV